MKATMINLMVAAALSYGGTPFAAEETGKARPATPASAVPPAPAPGAAPSAKEHLPAPGSVKAKPLRPKNLDLRHCLDLESATAIAKCAGE